MKGLYFLGEVLLRSPGIKTGDYKKRFDLEPHMSVLGTRMHQYHVGVYFRSCLLHGVK